MKTEIVRVATPEERLILTPFVDRARQLAMESREADRQLDTVQQRLSGDPSLVFDPHTLAWVRYVEESQEVG